jgi:hypothetical protein
MPAPETIRQLVKRFEENLDSYRSSKYNETQLQFVIESTDRAIDRLVYELSRKGMIYGLTEEEIRIVEKAR